MHTRAFKNLFSGRPSRRRGRKPATRLSLEQLEPRTLLSVLFTDNFNTDTGGSSGNGGGTIGGSSGPSFYTYRDVSLVPNAGPAGTGDTAVQIQYHQPDESSYPGLGMDLGTNFNNLSEYYIQFYAKVDSNIIGGMKFIKFFGSQGVPASGNSANTTFGIEYANDRMTYVNYGNGSTTTNDAQVSTTYAGTTTTGMEPNIQYTADAGGSINIADGNWHLIQVHVKYDTSFAASNGALDVWVDGVHVLGVTGLTNRNDQNSTVWNNVEWGNYTDTTLYNEGNNGPFSLYVDDVTISTTQISGTPPAAPTSLTPNPGNNQIVLNWTGSSGAYSYNVFRGTTSGGEGTTPYATGVTGTSWTDTSVTAGTTYYYEVTGVNTSGQGGKSAEASGTAVSLTMTNVGTPPAGTPSIGYSAGTWTVIGSGNIDSAGGSPQDNFGFAAESMPANTSEVMYAEITSSSVSTTNFGGGIVWRDGTAQDATNVYVGWSYGNGVWMKERTTVGQNPTTVKQVTGINLPVWLEVVCTAEGGGNYTFTGYYKTGSTWILLGTSSTIAMSNPMAGLTVVNADSTTAETMTFTNLAISGGVPGQVTGLGATAGTGNVTLNWSTDSGATTYNVYRGTTSNGESATPYTTGISTTNWTDTAATNGTTYYYEVTGVNGSGEGAKSSEVSATPIAIPGSLSATVGNGEMVLAWTSAAGAGTYDVYRGTTSGGEGTTPYATGVTGTSWTDTSVTAGTTYYYEVTGVNTSGQGGKSAEASGTAVSLTMTNVGTPPAGTPSIGYSAGTWTVIGSGNIDSAGGSPQDNFGFAAESMPANTSEVMYAEITSSSVSTTNFGGGIVWRDGTAQDATNVYVGWSYGNGVWMKERTTVGQNPTTVKQVTGINLPVWLEVVCTAEGGGNYTFTGYYKTGSTWILLGTSSTIAMSNPMAGLTVVNADSTTAETMTFANMDPHPLSGSTSAPNPISDHWTQLGSMGTIDFSDSYLPGLLVNSDDASALSIASVALTPYLPAGSTDQDLDALMPGWTADSNNTLNVTGTGSDIGAAFDPFNFASDSVTGDQTIHAEVTN